MELLTVVLTATGQATSTPRCCEVTSPPPLFFSFFGTYDVIWSLDHCHPSLVHVAYIAWMKFVLPRLSKNPLTYFIEPSGSCMGGRLGLPDGQIGVLLHE